MASKLKLDVLETGSGSGTIALNNQLSGMTAASMPSGSVLQVVSVKYDTYVTVTSGSFQDSGLTLSITPTYSNSKIMVLANVDVRAGDSGYNARGNINLVRGSTTLNDTFFGIYVNAGSDANHYGKQDFMQLDSPATTSSITYKVQGRVNGADSIRFNQDSTTDSTLTLMEIKG